MRSKQQDQKGKSKRSRSVSLSDSDRGTVNTAMGLILAAVMVSSAVVASVAVPSSSGASANPQGDIQALEEGLESSLDSTNQQVINKDATEDRKPGKRIALKIRNNIPEHAWNNMPEHTRQLLTSKIGTLVVQIEAQNNVDGELTRVEPVDDGVERGAVVKQHGTGQHTITDTVTETYTQNKRVFSHWDRVFDGYDRRFTGWKTVTVGYKQVQVGWDWRRTMKVRSYQVPVYRTKTVRVRKSRLRVDWDRHVHASRRWVPECGTSWGTAACGLGGMGHWETERTNHWHKNYYREYYWDYETRSVFSHYRTEYELVPAWEKVPVYEKRPITERRATYKWVPDYDSVARYKTVEVTKTREKTVRQEVNTAPFVANDKGDWTLATDVSKARDATMRIERADLTENPSEAMQFKAVDASGDTWTVSAYRDGDAIVLSSSAGPTVRVTAEFAKIDFAAGTVNGKDVGYFFAEGLDDDYKLQFVNGDEARGTYKILLVGTPTVQARDADVNDDRAGLTVVDGIVYSASFDVTIETADSTYSERITIKPDVTVGDSDEETDR